MAYTSIKVYTTFLDRVKDNVFSDKGGAGADCLFGCDRVRGADDTNAEGGVDSMRKAEAIANYGAVL